MKAVFLDRDGTINEDPGYLSQPSQMKLLPGAAEGLRLLQDAGFTLVVVSNQSGVGRGLVKEADLPAIHARLNELLAGFGVRPPHFYYCVHLPEADCECRKPKPKLLLQAAKDLRITLADSYMIGDKFSDIQVGHVAGCRASLLVRTGHGPDTEKKLKSGEAAFVGDTLEQCARWLLAAQSQKKSQKATP